MTAAIYYHPEGYTTTGSRLMGRNAAGESFLRGFIQYSTGERFWAQIDRSEFGPQFFSTVRRFGRNEEVHTLDRERYAELSAPGCVYHPGPAIGESAFKRAAFGHGSWSLCGITHTTSSAGAMDSIAELISAPVQPWDAVICTSKAVKDNVSKVLQAQVDYLKQRLGITKLVLPELPVIPLGIHTDDFVYTAQERATAREKIGAARDTLVVLYTGRLSFHAKAHPLAMYQALQKARLETGKEIILIECGWHANEAVAKAFADAAALACPGIKVVTLDGRKAENRTTAWASADVFCSLPDNIQETFGIVPIEAMAAGLPVVVSDWDGYRDTVRDEKDGYRIPTLMPQAGLGQDLALRHALEIDSYDRYCGYSCCFVAVDVEAAAAAFARLFNSAELRMSLGEAGRKQAREVYDWRVIIPQYEALWSQLGELRKAHGKDTKPHRWPARLDPFEGFAAYPTGVLGAQTVLGLVGGDVTKAMKRVQDYYSLAMIDFAKVMLPTLEEVEALLQMATPPKTAKELVQNIPLERQAFLFRALVWLVKLHVLFKVE